MRKPRKTKKQVTLDLLVPVSREPFAPLRKVRIPVTVTTQKTGVVFEVKKRKVQR